MKCWESQKREFHDSIMDLVKRKRLSTEPKNKRFFFQVKVVLIDEVVTKEEHVESHYMSSH